MNQTVLRHYGVLGMKWGVRRYRNPDGSLTPKGAAHYLRKDNKWASTKGEKIKRRAMRKVRGDMSRYVKNELLVERNAGGGLSSRTILAYNNKLASLMNDRVSDVRAPSGKALRFVAKRGEIGVHTAVADVGYNMEQLKKGVFNSGKVAYKSQNLMQGGWGLGAKYDIEV